MTDFWIINDNCEMADVWLEGGDYASISLSEGRIYQIRHGNGSLLKGADAQPYRLTSPLCADLRDGVFRAALSSAEGDRHLILSDEGAIPLTFNGYFTSLRVE